MPVKTSHKNREIARGDSMGNRYSNRQVWHSIKVVWNHLRSRVLPPLSPQAGQDGCWVIFPAKPDNKYALRKVKHDAPVDQLRSHGAMAWPLSAIEIAQ